jgi:hypothetical protein
MNADYETFFVVDDSKDGEFTRTPYNFYPIQADSGRGGLGLRIEVRGFQWSHVLAEDVIFWHYDIVNISDRNYDSCAFGFYSDPGVGSFQNSSPANSAYYSTSLDSATPGQKAESAIRQLEDRVLRGMRIWKARECAGWNRQRPGRTADDEGQ